MKTLPEIVKEHHRIQEMMMETGEITPEIEELLDAHDEDFEKKKDRYIGLIRHMEASIAEFDLIEKQAKQRKKTLNNAVDSMRDRLLYAMQSKGLKTARGGLYPASITHKTSTVFNPDFVPDELRGEMLASGLLKLVDKFDVAEIKKKYADSEFVVEDESEHLTLR